MARDKRKEALPRVAARSRPAGAEKGHPCTRWFTYPARAQDSDHTAATDGRDESNIAVTSSWLQGELELRNQLRLQL